jgi:hypothetical protein
MNGTESGTKHLDSRLIRAYLYPALGVSPLVVQSFESGLGMQTFFGKKNYLGVALAVVLLVVGFFLLGLKPATNKLALNVAPFILLLAYLVVLPWSLWKSTGKDERNS